MSINNLKKKLIDRQVKREERKKILLISDDL